MRETFYEAKRRHRRAGWRITAVAVVGVAVTSLPVALVLSPPLAALVLVVNDLLRVVLPMPDLVGDVVDLAGHVLPVDGLPEPSQPLTVGLVATVAALALLPGLVVVVVAWWSTRRLLLRLGAEGLLRALDARPPFTGDPEERQLANLVEETAVAAGIPPLRLLVLDHDFVNAAVVGSSVDDAVILVPRRLLARLDRRSTGALVADLVATAVNGDLRIAASIAATARTLDVLGAVVAAPTSSQARRLLRTLAATARHPGADPAESAEAAGSSAAGRDLHAAVDELVAVGNLDDVHVETSRTGSAWQALTFPLLMARVALSVMQLAVLGLMVNPLMALLWRRRRLLADAGAVELTRDPDALVTLFEYVQRHGTAVVAAPWSHCFVVGPGVKPDTAADDPAAEGAGKVALLSSAQRSQARAGTGAVDMVPYNPPVEQRLQRLAALGGTRTTEPRTRPSWAQASPLGPFVYPLVFGVLGPILVVAAVLLVVCCMVLASMAAALVAAVLAPLVALAHAVPG